MIRPGIYEHYKGNRYRVHFVAKWEADLSPVVVYEALDANPEGPYFVRPLDVFSEEVEVDGVKRPRYRYIG
jgi:hypothetical protein